jgi:hypothetical protein
MRYNSSIRTSFWGKYVDLIQKAPIGTLKKKLNLVIEDKRSAEVFEVWMPRSSIQNIIIGGMYIDHYGTLKIINRNTLLTLEAEVTSYAGLFKKANQKGIVEGFVYNSRFECKIKFNALAKKLKDATVELKGNWDKELSIKDHRIPNSDFECVWKADPEPENWDEIYRFSAFSLQLNKLTPEMERTLPSTDCRFRPDQRALENGDHDLATSEKHRLEKKQREATKSRTEEYLPIYFKKEEVERIDQEGTYEDWV